MCRASPRIGHDRANSELEKGRSAALDQKWNGASKHNELTQEQIAMSARSIPVWGSVPPELIEQARMSLPPSERPSFECVVLVGLQASVLQDARKGYCDSTVKQFHTAIKGAYGFESIKNALKALEVAAVLVTVKGGTKSKDGGRGAWRVFRLADEKELIPESYCKPILKPFVGSPDLPNNTNEPRVSSETSEVGNEPFSGSSDIPTPKESLYLSTPPLGEAEKNNSLKSEAPHSKLECQTCLTSTINLQHDRVQQLVTAVLASKPQRTSGAKTFKERTQRKAQWLLAHNETSTNKALLPILLEKVGELLSHDALVSAAEERLTQLTEQVQN
jgi:hypothetical protein